MKYLNIKTTKKFINKFLFFLIIIISYILPTNTHWQPILNQRNSTHTFLKTTTCAITTICYCLNKNNYNNKVITSKSPIAKYNLHKSLGFAFFLLLIYCQG